MPHQPALSVLLPVHNGIAHLKAALESVLAQTFSDWELIVVDDGSTDGSADVVRSYREPRLQLVRNATNLGLTASLNAGLRRARAAWIARHDADDVSDPHRFERQMSALAARPELRLLGSQAWQLDENGRKRGALDHACEQVGIRWEMLFDNAFFHSAVVFHRQTVVEAGAYDETFRYCQDYELWSRLTEAHPFANLPARLVGLRTRPTSMTHTMLEENLVENRRIVTANFRRTFGEAGAAADAQVALGFRSAAAVETLVALWDRRLPAYCSLHPGALSSSDLRRTLARQWLQLAFNRSGRSPLRSARLLLAASRRRLPILREAGRWFLARRFPRRGDGLAATV